MKSNFKLLVILILILMYPFQIIYAQFTNPLLPDQAFSAGNVYGRNTGCDILDYGDVYRVSVWEPSSTTQSFGWVVTSGSTQYTGTLAFTATGDITDPDVCLLIDPNTLSINAAVVYYDNTNSEWDLEFYVWDAPSSQFVSTSSFYQMATGSFGTAINIDENKSGDSGFAIVWDDVNGDIHTTVGDMSSLVLYNDLQLTSGTHPDVSMFYDGNIDVVHIAFIDGNGELTVLDYNFTDLASGNAGNSTIVLTPQSPPNSGVFSYPRIASPKGSLGGSVSTWTVVVEEIDISSPKYYIVGYNDGSATPIIFNNGSASSPADLTDVPNFYVSVCYDDNFPTDGIWVGWQFDDPAGNLPAYTNMVPNSGYSIVLQCNQNATPTGSLGYLQVPTSITANNGDFSGFLSLAGRNGVNEIFLTYQNIIINGSNVDDINFKTITGASGISSFRASTPTANISEDFDELNEDASLTLEILNMEGKLLYEKQIVKQDIHNKLSEFSKYFSSSIYFVRLTSFETSKVYRYKTLLGQ